VYFSVCTTGGTRNHEIWRSRVFQNWSLLVRTEVKFMLWWKTWKPSLEVAPTTLATKIFARLLLIYSFQYVCFRSRLAISTFAELLFSSCDVELCPMTWIFKADLDMVKVNKRAEYLGQRLRGHLFQGLFSLHAETNKVDCSTWSTRMVVQVS